MKIYNSIFRTIFLSCCLFFSISHAVAAIEQEPLHNALSLQGYTGILNTPSAHVTEEGWMYAIYTNQEESKWRKETPHQDNYNFSIGMFNFIELGGRFIEAPPARRDLSGNFKVTTAPLTSKNPLIPVLAAGVQDIGGGAVLLQTKYLVVSEDIWRFRLSGGYGKGPNRMKGLFAGGEFKAHDFVYLLGEHDTRETNIGVRAVMPQFWKVPFSFTATAKTAVNQKADNFEFSAGFTVPLDFKVREKRVENKDEGASNLAQKNIESKLKALETVPNLQNQETVSNSNPSHPQDSKQYTLESLRDNLIREGFINVRVGTRDKMLVVEYENTIFNHNELDALGIVTGMASKIKSNELDTLQVVIKRRDISMASVTMPLEQLRHFLEKPDGLRDLHEKTLISFENHENDGVNFVSGSSNSGIFNTSLILAPGLTTFIGTEVGAFDYLLSIKPELTTSLWKGAVVNTRWDVPIAWSQNLDDGGEYRSSRKPSQLERTMLFQALMPLPTVMLNVGAGMIVHDRYGILNEATWTPGEGDHRFRILQSINENRDSHQQYNMLLGSYRYFLAPLDLSLEGTAGKFWAEDKGLSLEMKRFWGDTSVSLYYKDTKGNDHKRWQAAGIQLSVPLTPSRDMKPLAKLQVRGSDEWSYAQETTMKNNNSNNRRGSLNYLAPYPLAINPQTSTSIYRSFYNRDRLSAGYIRQHLDQLRDAWLKHSTVEK